MTTISKHDNVKYERHDTAGPTGRIVFGFVKRTTDSAAYIHDNATGRTVAAPLNRIEEV